MNQTACTGGPAGETGGRRGVTASRCGATVACSTAGYRRALWTLLGLTAVFVTAALWSPPGEPRVVLCPFRALTHLPCPGCGMTRAFCALAHGEFWQAVRFNALSPLLFLAALYAWAHSAATVFGAERARLLLAKWPRPSPLACKAMLALVLAWWVARLAGGF